MRKFWRRFSLSLLIIILLFLFSIPPTADIDEIRLAIIQEGGERLLYLLQNVKIFLGRDLTNKLAELIKQNLFSPPRPALKPAAAEKIYPDKIPVIFIHGFDPLNTHNPGERQFMNRSDERGPGFISRVISKVDGWQSNFQALIFKYPTIQPVPDNANALKKLMDEVRFLQDEVILVGYSLGGLIARYFDSNFGDYKAKALIMIATPNRGSQVIDKISKIIEDAVRESEDSPSADLLYQIAYYLYQSKGIRNLKGGSEFYKKLDEPKDYYYGIAGTDPFKSDWLTTFFAQYFEGPNDGIVSVKSVGAGLPPGRSVKLCPYSHLTILHSDQVVRWTANIINKVKTPKSSRILMNVPVMPCLW